MCQQSYGFLPCTTTVLGNLFLVLAYGFLMVKGANFLSVGSELLLEILGPGLVGGLLLPILGALPEALIVLVSGLSGSRDTAQTQVLMGMGLLAGSTVFLLTLLWGTCVVAGKCDIGPNGEAIDLQNCKGFSLTGSGVSTDLHTTYAARIMVISVVPFIIAGFPNMMKSHGHSASVLLGLIVSFFLVLAYCLYQYSGTEEVYQYQVSDPWIQLNRFAYIKNQLLIAGVLRHVHVQTFGRLVNDDGTPNEDVLRKLFHKIDMDESRTISRAELHALVVGVNFDELNIGSSDAVDRIMRASPMEDQFVEGMKRWINKAKDSAPAFSGTFSNFIHMYLEKMRQKHDQLHCRYAEASGNMDGNQNRWYTTKAVGLLLLGTAIVAAFAGPLVDAVQNISSATHIPPFLVSFVVLPMATNSTGEPLSSVMCASNKKQRTASLTFSELYRGVTMKNTLCLGVFLALIYVRNLKWEFSSEVLMVVLVCLVMGLFASFQSTFPLWTCLVAYVLYPLSLVVVYVLDHVFHWS